jgi:hypothetical protein
MNASPAFREKSPDFVLVDAPLALFEFDEQPMPFARRHCSKMVKATPKRPVVNCSYARARPITAQEGSAPNTSLRFGGDYFHG